MFPGEGGPRLNACLLNSELGVGDWKQIEHRA